MSEGFSTHDLFFSNGYKAAIEEMSKRGCGTCKYWMGIEHKHSFCQRFYEWIGGSQKLETAHLTMQNGSSGKPLFLCSKDFGCTLWEKKNDLPTEGEREKKP